MSQFVFGCVLSLWMCSSLGFAQDVLPEMSSASQATTETTTLPDDLKIPRYDVGLTIEATGAAQKKLAVERVAQVQLNGDLWQVNWLAVAKVAQATTSKYPTYQVQTTKGILEGPMVGKKSTYFHPLLWPEGYTVLTDALPLWIDSIYLDLKRGQSEAFSLGFLQVNTATLENLDDTQHQEILYFRNLYAGYTNDAKGQSVVKSFNKHFFNLQWVRDAKFDVTINTIKHRLPVKILGNKYFALTVLNQYDNPLVLGLEFFPDNVPQVFAKSFTFLQKNFEFQVTQIQF